MLSQNCFYYVKTRFSIEEKVTFDVKLTVSSIQNIIRKQNRIAAIDYDNKVQVKM